jgi:hypothetical protein
MEILVYEDNVISMLEFLIDNIARNFFSNPNRQTNRHQTRTQADIHSKPWTGNNKQDENQRTLGSVSVLAVN